MRSSQGGGDVRDNKGDSIKMSGAGVESKPIEALALDHAWKWFEYHATQRMTMIRFYLIAAGGIAAGTGALLATGHENLLAGLLSALGAFTSLAFKRIDRRVSDLVKLGEDALKHEQAKMGAALCIPTFEICRMAGERPKGARLYTYGENFRLLFDVLFLGFITVTAISVFRSVAGFGGQICGMLK
jgi:hypothetical protein